MKQNATALPLPPEDEEDWPDLESALAARPMGEALAQQGLITQDQLRIALTEQKQSGALLGATLVALGFLDEETLALALAQRAGIAAVSLESFAFDEDLARRVPRALALAHLVLPLRLKGNALILAMADPFDIVSLDAVRRLFPRETDIEIRIASRSALRAALVALYGRGPSFQFLLHELEGGAAKGDSPVIALVDALLEEAAARKATDIHLEPEASQVRVRLRFDGDLEQTHAFHPSLWAAVSQRVKLKAGMDIAATRSIQDGRFVLTEGGRNIDCRVAALPSMDGETIVIRLLDRQKTLLPFEALGYSGKALADLTAMAEKPYGIILVTGPTGSGKTTTLYSLLKKISRPEIHIATLEDPVEYRLEGVRQTSIQDAQGLGFAQGVRGLLRMDPDVILIGEIRDAETAQMALRAAMTGHQVYTTLHCTDALGAIPRLLDLGLGPALLAGHLGGIVAQRLVPRKDGSGRTVIAETLPITAGLDELIARGASRRELWQAARQEGFVTLREDGLAKIESGLITLEALRRHVDLTRKDPAA